MNLNTLNRITFFLPVCFALVGLLALGWLAGAPAQAAPLATWYVAPGGDDANDCLSPATACATIGAAVGKADNDDTIQIAAGTYQESGINIFKRLTLNGAAAAATIVDGGQNGRVFLLTTDSALRHLTIQNGRTPEDSNIFTSGGGGLRVGTGANVLLQHVTIQNNATSGSSGLGGGIFNTGNLTIDQSQIISNTAEGGGGIYHYFVSGALTITHSLIADNQALGSGGGGGGINTGRPLTLVDSILRGNNATYAGGGLMLSNAGEALLERATIMDNLAGSGGAIFSQVIGESYPAQQHRQRQRRQRQLRRPLRRRNGGQFCHPQQHHRGEPAHQHGWTWAEWRGDGQRCGSDPEQQPDRQQCGAAMLLRRHPLRRA
jgi:hypothetical protein